MKNLKKEEAKIKDYSEQEISMSKKLSYGYENWKNSIINDQNITGEKLVIFRAFHLGIIANEILEITDLTKLQIIFSSYQKNLLNNNENWNELSRTILK